MFYVVRHHETSHGTHEPNRGTHTDFLEDLKTAARYENKGDAINRADDLKAQMGLNYAVVSLEIVATTERVSFEPPRDRIQEARIVDVAQTGAVVHDVVVDETIPLKSGV